jgi:hypothetical protein
LPTSARHGHGLCCGMPGCSCRHLDPLAGGFKGRWCGEAGMNESAGDWAACRKAYPCLLRTGQRPTCRTNTMMPGAILFRR